jgi:hypothetical protein
MDVEEEWMFTKGNRRLSHRSHPEEEDHVAISLYGPFGVDGLNHGSAWRPIELR